MKKAYIDLEYTLLDNDMNNQQLEFPKLSLDDLYQLSLGPYQINNSMSYYAEHQNEGIFLVHKFEPPMKNRKAGLDFEKYGTYPGYRAITRQGIHEIALPQW